MIQELRAPGAGCVLDKVTVFLGFPGGSDGKDSAFNAGDIREWDSILWLGRCPGGGHGNPLLYSCLENPMDSLTGYSP